MAKPALDSLPEGATVPVLDTTTRQYRVLRKRDGRWVSLADLDLDAVERHGPDSAVVGRAVAEMIEARPGDRAYRRALERLFLDPYFVHLPDEAARRRGRAT